MNFSSADAGDNEAVDEVKTALCYANCACPSQTVQLKTYDPATKRQTYYSDCFQGIATGTYYKYAEKVCETRKGTLASLTTPIKNYFLLTSVIPFDNTLKTINTLHIGLHRNTTISNGWLWYGYDNTVYPLENYQNWAPGFNSGSAGDGIYLDKLDQSTWAWMTEGASSNSFAYMCQIRACDSTPRDCDRSGWLNIQKKRKVSNLN
uniref:C-type lectin domain-containing protein n=1 Tax=Acrobeloides nanus TaxID=290746 RepID=A0A914D6P7_9BILA